MDDVITNLANALRCLPGVGPKSAQRMVYHLLKMHREKGLHLAKCLDLAMHSVRNCERCNNYTTENRCAICTSSRRDKSTFCIVESPADIQAIEQSKAFLGSYYVLMGKISPLDGVGVEDIGLPKLRSVMEQEGVQEIILALSSSVEGLATSHAIRELLRDLPIRISQLAQGIPSGSELEFLDGNTITNALRNRALFSFE